MTEKEAIECLDNIFTDMLIEKELGIEYAKAVKVLLAFYKHYKNGFIQELESNRKNTFELLEQDCKIRDYKKAIKEKCKIINEMAKQIEVIRENSEEDCFVPRKVMPIDACVKTECKECIKQYFERKVEQ